MHMESQQYFVFYVKLDCLKKLTLPMMMKLVLSQRD
jgi:hypothetical protein